MISLSLLMAVSAVLYLGRSVLLVTVPAFALGLHGITLNPGTTAFARVLGALLLGLGLANWTAKDAWYVGTRGLVLGNFVFHLVGFFPMVVATLTGVMSALGWLPVALHFLLAVGFGYYQMARPLPTPITPR